MTKCCDVKIGSMKHSLELQEPANIDDGAGGRAKLAWSTIKTVKASLKTKSGSTRVFAQAKDMPVSHTLQTRYFAAWSAANANKRRFKFGDRIFKIIFVNNIEEDNRFLEYTLQENVPT